MNKKKEIALNNLQKANQVNKIPTDHNYIDELENVDISQELKESIRRLKKYKRYALCEDSKKSLMQALFEGVTHAYDRAVLVKHFEKNSFITLHKALLEAVNSLRDFRSVSYVRNFGESVNESKVQEQLLQANKDAKTMKLLKDIMSFDLDDIKAKKPTDMSRSKSKNKGKPTIAEVKAKLEKK